MSTRTYQMVFSGAGTVTLPAGVFFLVRSAVSPLTIETRGTPGAPVRFENVGAGLSYGPVTDPSKKWTYLDVTSAAAQPVEIIISEESEVRVGSVVSVSGSVTVVEVGSSALSTPAAVSVADLSAQTIAANGARKSIEICNPSTNLGSFWIQANGGGGAAPRGIELQPGQVWSPSPVTTAAIDVRNDSGGAQSFTYLEAT